MENKEKQFYEAPSIILVDLAMETIVCQSGGVQNYYGQDPQNW
jgi:hypothetical protein